MELDHRYGLFGLPDDDDWILNASCIDKTFMRHKISYDLFRMMDSLNIAPFCAYVNVEVNNQKQGIYVLMEETDASVVGLDKSDTMAMLFKEPPVFYREKLRFVQDSLNYYQQKYPKIHESEKNANIEKFREFLFESDNKSFADNFNCWLDLNNIIDWHILLLLSNNGDGVVKNFYLYKHNTDTPFRISIWDYDHSFGRDGDNEPNMMKR